MPAFTAGRNWYDSDTSEDWRGRLWCGYTTVIEEECCGVSNPTLPGSGVKIHDESDYDGAGAAPLQLKRFYRSRWPDGLNNGLRASPDWGAGWKFSYQAQLSSIRPQARSAPTLHALRPDGSVQVFYGSAGSPRTWRSNSNRNVLTELPGAGWRVKNAEDDSTETYNVSGKLISITARNGLRTSLSYDAANRLSAVTNAYGRKLSFTYDASGRVASLVAPGGGVTAYAYDTVGNLRTVTWPGGASRRYHYEDARFPGAITGVTDELGTRIGTYTYDNSGRVASTVRANGSDRVTFSYAADGMGRPASQVSTPAGYVTYTFQDTGGIRRPTSTSATADNTYVGNVPKEATYQGAYNEPLKRVATDGTVTFFTYDSRGRLTERATYPVGYASFATRPALANASQVVTTRWHTTWNLPLQVAEPRQITSHTYDARGNLTSSTVAATSDTTGATQFAAAPTGATTATSSTYATNNLPTTIVQSGNGVETQRWTLTYNASGDATGITDVTGAQSASMNYDVHGRQIRLAPSNGALATFAWNADGQMSAASLPDYSATLTYTAQKRLAEVRLSTGEWLRVTYSASGAPTEVLNNGGQVQKVSGLPQHWLQSDRPLSALQTLLAHAVEQSPKRLSDMFVKSALAQVPVPPMPSWLLRGLAVAGASRNADQERAAAGACCGGIPSDREIQERFQRTLPYTLLQGAVGLLDALTQDILTMKGRAELKTNMQCAKDNPYYQSKPPLGCWEAHHIVAIADRRAEKSRTILRNVGIDINSPANGVWMACDKHRGMHTNAYYDRVESRLTTTAQDKLSIERTLAVIRSQLQSGTFIP